jgi:hypothetical protein
VSAIVIVVVDCHSHAPRARGFAGGLKMAEIWSAPLLPARFLILSIAKST